MTVRGFHVIFNLLEPYLEDIVYWKGLLKAKKQYKSLFYHNVIIVFIQKERNYLLKHLKNTQGRLVQTMAFYYTVSVEQSWFKPFKDSS